MTVTEDSKHETRMIRRRRWKEREFAARLLDNKRLAACGRVVTPGADGVEVIRTQHGRAYYRNTLQCRMIWICPNCAPFEFNKRQFLLADYAAQWSEAKHGLAMMTLTFRHNRDMPLADTLAAMKSAYRRFTSGRAAASWRASLGIEHTVSATEITHGEAGWHPHLHVLLFRQWRTPISDTTEATGRELWREAGSKERLMTSHKAAFDLRAGRASVAAYLAKFGRSSRDDITREVTGGYGKHGRRGSRTPAELLTDAEQGEKQAAALFREYAEATRGRNLLVQSRGLAALMGTAELIKFVDSHAGGPREAGISVIHLDRQQWRRFIRAPYKSRLTVLEQVELGRIEEALTELQRIGVYDV